jgi:tetratricopeptide (TPR) repeat protein
MVKLFLLMFLLFNPYDIAVEVPPKVQVEISKENSFEGRPLVGMISVIHEARQKIQQETFLLDGKPLKVEFIEEIQPSPQQLFSADDPRRVVETKFRFILPPREKGLYVLNAISVKVAGRVFSSIPTTFSVSGFETTRALRLEAKISEKAPYYPGQKLHFEYRIYFQQPIELTREELSLFKFSSFRPNGAPKIDTVALPESQETMQSITQEMVAEQAGKFQVPPSIIEGFPYEKDQKGKIVIVGGPLQARCDGFSFEVSPFPSRGQPSSFSGAIGSFTWSAKVLSSLPVIVKEKLRLELVCQGQGDLDTVELPNFARQKIFQDRFIIEPLATTGEIVEGRKHFIIELRPQFSDLQQIPEIETSSFDPIFSRYHTFKIPPVPIKVIARGKEGEVTSEDRRVSLIDIESVELLQEGDIVRAHISFFTLFEYTTLLLALIFGQLLLKKIIKEKASRPKVETSRDLFVRAFRARYEPNVALPLIEQALILRLFEAKEIASPQMAVQELPESGIAGEIRRFLLSLEEGRFSRGAKEVEMKELLDTAAALFWRLKKGHFEKIGLFSLLFILLFSPFSSYAFEDDGYLKYTEGEREPLPPGRKRAFNQALSYYLHYDSPLASGKLNYNIANCYYQLGEYGLSLLYYSRAESLLPRDTKVHNNLLVALKKTGQTQESFSPSYPFFDLFRKFSLYERQSIFLAALFMAFIFLSLRIWFSLPLFRRLAILFAVVSSFFIVNFMYIVFFAPIEAIAIRPAPLLTGPGNFFSKVTEEPILTGFRVRCLDVVEGGKWLKVKTADGQEGYVSSDQVRLIET